MDEIRPTQRSGMISTPVAILISGVLITVAVLYSQGDLPFLKKNSSETTENKVTNQDSTPEGKLTALAGKIGLKESDFRACLEKMDDAEVKKDMSDASAVGIGGTPGFIVGKRVDGNMVEGLPIFGAFPYESFVAVIEAFMSGDDKKILEAANALAKLSGEEEKTSLDGVLQKISLDDDPKQGSDGANVTIVEFSDYECPFCKRHFQQTYPQIKSNYVDTNKVQFVFRDLPLPFHDPIATQAAVAANCARDQGGDEAYYKFHDEYFKNTQTNGKGLL